MKYLPKQKENKKYKVAVALSGGVDSSVSALLLKQAGFQVVGFYAKCWLPSEYNKCKSETDERYAFLVANQIGIPFYSIDLIQEYKNKVFKYFIDTYRKGETPNPDVLCNEHLKFGVLFDKIMGLGFDFFATGHYAKISKIKGEVFIEAHKDSNKDQSYFLARVPKENLSKIIFPLSDITKIEVRRIAKKNNLITAEKPDSQGICFIGEVNIREFLSKYIDPKTGLIVEYETNKVIGKHPGVFYYTIGQRKDIRIPNGPYFVIKKDLESNTLFVTKDRSKLYSKSAIISNISYFMHPKNLLGDKFLSSKIRSQQKPSSCVLSGFNNYSAKVEFEDSQWGIAKGQILVVYRKNKVALSGFIS